MVLVANRLHQRNTEWENGCFEDFVAARAPSVLLDSRTGVALPKARSVADLTGIP